MAHHDSDYYRARAIEQRGAASEAGKPEVASIHHELAAKFERLADQQDALGEEFDALAAEAFRLIGQPPA